MKHRIEQRKKELAGQKKNKSDAEMEKYMSDERAAEEASSSMRARIEQHKKELAEKKKEEEEEMMRKYMEEEKSNEAATQLKEQIARNKAAKEADKKKKVALLIAASFKAQGLSEEDKKAFMAKKLEEKKAKKKAELEALKAQIKEALLRGDKAEAERLLKIAKGGNKFFVSNSDPIKQSNNQTINQHQTNNINFVSC